MRVSGKAVTLLTAIFLITAGMAACSKDPVDVGENRPPSVSCIAPVDGATGRAIDVELQWNASDPDGDPLRFDVKLDKNTPPSIAKATDIADRRYQTEGLDYGTQYYWQITVRDDADHEVEGPVWSFTTMADTDVGTIVIDQTPDALAGAGWALSGPQNQTGSGDATLTGMKTGTYTLAWNDVAGYTAPSSDTKTLDADGTITFTGTYVAETSGEFVLIPAGTFMMGSPTGEPGRYTNETRHQVTLTRGFYMSKYEVTEEWWYEVMGGTSTTSQLPKGSVSWDMAVAFCNALSIKEGLTPAYTINGPDGDATWNRSANGYRLPTEAEWEYACRAGTQTAFANGPITNIYCEPLDPVLDQIGWYCGNSGDDYHEVGQKQTNAWGLYDMHGNKWEWVWDGYRNDYENLSAEDPVHDVGPGAYRVLRGGSWDDLAQYCRSAARYGYAPGFTHYVSGLRPVRSAF